MNNTIISKDVILEMSKNLIMEQGWTAINIRSVATACGVSIGTIYNYFASKADLVADTIESVWHEIFHLSGQEPEFKSFLECIEWFFQNIEKGSLKYPGFFTLHSMSFLGEDKSKGQQLMQHSWNHIKQSLCMVLLNDKNVRPDAFNQQFTPEGFVELIFSLMISALLREDYHSSTIIEVIKRSIY